MLARVGSESQESWLDRIAGTVLFKLHIGCRMSAVFKAQDQSFVKLMAPRTQNDLDRFGVARLP